MELQTLFNWSSSPFGSAWIRYFGTVTLVNVVLKSMARSGKKGNWLGGRLRADRRHAYMVPIFGQMAIPVMFALSAVPELTSVLSKEGFAAWWFGSFAHQPSPLFLYLGAYFLSDALVHWNTIDVLIRLHHVVGFASCLVADASSTKWRGLNLALTLVFEVGSYALNVNDVVFKQTYIQPWAQQVLFWTSLVPMLWVAHACVVATPASAGEIFLTVGALLGGGVRILECKKMRDAYLKNLPTKDE